MHIFDFYLTVWLSNFNILEIIQLIIREIYYAYIRVDFFYFLR